MILQPRFAYFFLHYLIIVKIYRHGHQPLNFFSECCDRNDFSFRDGKLYKNKRVLCIGGSFSAHDLALQEFFDTKILLIESWNNCIAWKCWKFGSDIAHITHRSATNIGYKWPIGIIERPILTKINGSKVFFKDGSSEDYDVIIKCTGYQHYFPFMRWVNNNSLLSI